MSVVLPESMWAEIPMFRILWMSLLMMWFQSPLRSSLVGDRLPENESCCLCWISPLCNPNRSDLGAARGYNSGFGLSIPPSWCSACVSR